MSKEFHDQLIVVDALQYNGWDREIFEMYKAGGLSGVNVTLAIWEDARTTLDNVSHWYRRIREHSDLLMLGRTGEDIETAKAQGKTAIILGFQNASPFEDDLGLVEIFWQLGVRIVQLTYNLQNHVGASCYEPNDSGLTRYGKNVVKEMNRLGMLVDVSHVGEQTTLDAIKASTRPIAATHANPQFFVNHPRNKSDKVLSALKSSGGMIGLAPYTHLIGGHETPLKAWTEMVAKTVDFMGIDLVGIGSDMSIHHPDNFLQWIREGKWTHETNWGAGSAKEGHKWVPWPDWFGSPADAPKLTQGLLDQGFSKDEVAKIVGLNFLRLFKEGFKPL